MWITLRPKSADTFDRPSIRSCIHPDKEAASAARLSDLMPRHRRGRADREPRSADRMRRRLRRGGPRSAALWTIDGLQIRGERPCRARIARVVLLQEQEQRKTEAALGKTACAAMTCRATVRKT